MASILRMERFREVCIFHKLKPLKMIYDVVTRWDSAYRMLARAIFLRKAVDHYAAEDKSLQRFLLTQKEWNQATLICSILLPFKMASIRLQSMKRPGIDSVFWDYEALFNKIDAIKVAFTCSEYANKEWVQEIHLGVEELSTKL